MFYSTLGYVHNIAPSKKIVIFKKMEKISIEVNELWCVCMEKK